MACGCAVVATGKVGIHSELIQHGETGYLFPAGDVKKLQSILEEVMTHPNQEMIQRVRKTAVSQWDIEVEVSKLTQLYLQ
jgi:glycosyltransferase involved in cell wall biosynthesis